MKFIKDSAHYLKRGVSKGSEAEIQMLLNARTGEDGSDVEASGKLEAELRDRINNPRYIIRDFETDTSGEVHVPNLSISQVLKVSGNGSFERSRVGEQVVFEGYDAYDQFCNFSRQRELWEHRYSPQSGWIRWQIHSEMAN